MPKSKPPVPPPSATSSPLPAPQRTPPDLKWLLNERAALAGAQERSRERLTSLHRRLARAEAAIERLQKMAAEEQGRLQARESLLASFDTTVSLAHPKADPQAAGVVRAWAGRYGERGSLKAYLTERLQEVAPAGAAGGPAAWGQSMTALIDAVIEDFQLYIATPTERVNLRMSVRTTLRNLRSAGLADSRMGVDHLGRPMTYWFWRQATTLDDLRALVASQAEA